jgi:hypothetical protein
MIRKYLRPLAVLVGAAIIGLPTQAQAAFELRLSDGTTTVTIVDDGAGDLANTTAGQIIFAGSVGTFTINVTTGLGDPAAGHVNTDFSAHMHLDNVSVSSAAGGTLTIELSQTNLSLTDSPGGISLRSVFGGVTAGTVEAWQILDLDNALFAANGTGEAEVHHGPFSGPAFADVGTDLTSGPYTAGDDFSLTERVVISHGGEGTTSFNIDSLATVPVPPGIALALSALPVLGLGYLRRRKATKAETVA